MAEKATVRLPEDLVRRAKRATAEGRSLTALPGIDLNDSAALQELDDIALVKRPR
jgi:hypothetical protein